MARHCHTQFEQAIALLARNQPLFFALGDLSRQEIIILLGRHARLSVGELTSYTNLSRPAVSHHLKVLKRAGLLRETRDGVKRIYHPTFHDSITNMEELMATIRTIKEIK